MSLVARYLESVGIPCVVLGSARDIVEECGVARFSFLDFPLGNPCGKPWDADMQRDVVGGALTLLDSAWEARTTIQRPQVWDERDDKLWRNRYMRVDDSNRETLARAGEERRMAQAARKQA